MVFDALHHSRRQAEVVRGIATALRPGGWVLFGEPSVLRGVSPGARRASKDLGWVERGIKVSAPKGDCAAAGLTEFRRFFEGTSPYESRSLGFGRELIRLVAANVAFAPRSSMWLAGS